MLQLVRFLAQAPSPSPYPYRASAGTLVSAVFENLGYRYQSYILDQLRAAFVGDVGGFLYLIGVSAAVFAVAIRGSLKLGPWLLIGPPLFFATVLARTPVSSVQWQFAKQPRPQAEVGRYTDATIKNQHAAARNANVSILFARYNHLISATVQEVMKIIIGTRPDVDKSFIFKGQLFAAMYSRTVENTGLSDLIRYAMMSQCRAAVEAARTIQDPLSTPKMRRSAQFDPQFDMKIPLSGPSAAYIADRILKLGAAAKAAAALGGGTAAAGLFHQRAAKIRELQGTSWSCRQIWSFVYAGLIEEGALEIKSIRQLAEVNGMDGDAMLGKLAAAARLTGTGPGTGGSSSAAQNLTKLTRLAALYILRNTVANESTAALTEGTANLAEVFPSVQVASESEAAKTEYARVAGSEWSEKTRMIMAASNLPYYQGIILCVLATTFPFFALLLLVRGKHAGFLLWFVIWMWVKSWDIGFAVVMQLDEVLFSLMSMNKLAASGKDVLTQNFAFTMYVLRELDPTVHFASYCNFIAVSIGSIPIVTSQLIMSGLSGGAGLVASGINRFSGGFAEAAHSTQASAAVSNMRFELGDYKMDSVRGLQKNRLGVPMIGQISGSTPVIGTSGSQIRIAPSTSYFNAGASRRGGSANAGYLGAVAPSAFVRSPVPRSEVTGGRGLHERNQSASMAAVIRGGLRALANPTTASFEFWDNLNFRQKKSLAEALHSRRSIADGGLRAAGALGERVAGAFVDTILGTNDEDIKVTTAHGEFDATYSHRGRELAFMIRLYGAIEVPIAADSGHIAEADKELKLKLLEIDAYASFLDGMAEAIANGKQVPQMIRQNNKMKKLHEKMSRTGADVNRINWGSNETMRYLGGLKPDQFNREMQKRVPFMLPGLGHR